MKFIDLFAGLGGFHQALSNLGHTCVFASEIDPDLAALYKKNFGITPKGDIRVFAEKVPPHDILCAGFPCQPFSKAGEQLGFDCPEWGDLFTHLVKILKRHEPRYLLIENVPNIVRHNEGETWKTIKKKLEGVGYTIKDEKLSPHMFGVPQIRERAIIVGDRLGLKDFAWPPTIPLVEPLNIRSVLIHSPRDARELTPASIKYLAAWQNLLSALPKSEALPSFPIWAHEFGATYPASGKPPHRLSATELSRFKGTFGISLKKMSKADILKNLPPYATNTKRSFPSWKTSFIEDNRAFYRRHKKVIDRWLPQIQGFAPSFQKLEWNWKDGPRDIWSTVVQFRASGIRAKRPESAPSLVALTTSQVPVITWEKRYMTMRECARLQSMEKLKYLPNTQGAAFKALGNAVNVKVIQAVSEKLFGYAKKNRSAPKKLDISSKKSRKKFNRNRRRAIVRSAA